MARRSPEPSADLSAILHALARLAAKGAYLGPLDANAGPAGPFAVFSARDAHASASSSLSASAIASACSRGWLAPDTREGCYRIAAAGIQALRRAKSGAAATGTGQSPKPARTRKVALRHPGSAHGMPGGPLAWLRQRRDRDGQPLVTEPQYLAGERLAGEFWQAQLSPRVTADWSATASGRRVRRSAPGTGVDLSDHVVAARTRVYRALSMVGPELAGILVDVCCRDIGLECAGRARGWPQRSAKIVLQLALTSLARHYGLLPPEPLPGMSRLRHWGEEGYKPNLDAWRT